MPTPLPSVPLAVPRLAVGAFAALLVLIASASSGASLAHADEPATATSSLVTVSCTSASELMNTGYDSDADGRAPVDSVDPRWTVASGDVDALTGFSAPNGTTPATLVMPPPPGAVFLPAFVRDPGPWSAPDSTRAQWISAATADPNQTSARGDFFYRYRFVLDPTVDPSSFAVDVTWLVDNAVAGAWVNGILQTGVGSPDPDGDPYDEPGYLRPYSARLAGSWQTGENTVDVQVKSSGLLEGFAAWGTSEARCASIAPTPAPTPVPSTAAPASPPPSAPDASLPASGMPNVSPAPSSSAVATLAATGTRGDATGVAGAILAIAAGLGLTLWRRRSLS